MDYRELDEKFDRIVSVGMFEHVGRKFYKKFFNQIENLLKDDGVSLIHTIGSVDPPRDPHPWITKYIFPGGYTPSLSEVTNPNRKSGPYRYRYRGSKTSLLSHIKTLERKLY